MNEDEIEQEERKVSEYWAKTSAKKFSIYNDLSNIDFKNSNSDDSLPYKPTAVLTKTPPNQPARKKSIYDIGSLDFTT